MGYNLKTITIVLEEKNLAEDGLVAWGQNNSKNEAFSGGIAKTIAERRNPYFTISMAENSIIIIPFSNTDIKFEDKIVFDADKIKEAAIEGFFGKRLRITTIDDRTSKFSISFGASMVEQILKKLKIKTVK